MTASRKRLTSWVAMFAILLSALAPAISHAMTRLSGAEGVGWDVICTAFGMVPLPREAQSPAADASDDGGALPKGAAAMNACAYCSVHAGSNGLLPPLAVEAPQRHAVFVLHAPDMTAPAWRADHGFAEPRAPPIA